ncbi:(2Fe-2S)-binding protein [Frankia sp. CcI156]|nr:ferredoxin subunit of nitrite reductase and ring-hydroxylating dioxygenase [Frankia sp. CcI6]OFB43156.1 (2Fe-2S)-binding protein [Frankia sp. CgIM4]OHV54753.1 (2Fe-2S)-binding protein [Frankia sp. CgIS1]ONH26182.1 (2Fe-2S)-binding protein [Frankia sp. CcI156]
MVRIPHNVLVRPAERLERAEALDPVAVKIRDMVRRSLHDGTIRDTLHGVPLGHPLHPALAALPIGTWISAGIVDLLAGRHEGSERAARVLIATGLLAAVSAAASGLADYSELHERQLRVGVAHAATNSLAACCYAASLGIRWRGNGRLGRRLALLGLATASTSAYLGGHLAHRQASGANHTEEVPHLLPPGWHPLALLDELADGRPEARLLRDVPVVLLRKGDHVDVLAGRCSHLSGPLHKGEIIRRDGFTCLRCPWHGSTFRVTDGAVVHGPATAPQPRFDVWISDGEVRVRLPGAG